MKTRTRGMRGLAAALGLAGLLLLGSGARAAESVCSLDIDGSGEATALTDGLLLIRHQFGFTDTTLTDGALSSGCARCTGVEIAEHLAAPACQALFDADGDGTLTALTDGLLVIRHLFGFSGSTLTDGALGSGAARTTAEAIAAWLDRGVQPAGEAPRRVQLVGATSVQGDRIDLEWLATVDNDTPPEEIRYRLHTGNAPDFVPDAATFNSEVIGAAQGSLTGLTPNTRYYLKVEAVDATNHSSWSNALSAVTASGDPLESSAPRRILDAANAPELIVTDDSVQYQLPPGDLPPAPGDLVVSAEGDGFLRRATAVSQSGGQATIQTEPAALAEAFDTLEFATEIKLIDLPASALQTAAAYDPSSGKPPADTRRVAWPEHGLTLIDGRPASLAVPMAAAASDPIDCDGLGGSLSSKFDSPLQVRYPEAACVEAGACSTSTSKPSSMPPVAGTSRLPSSPSGPSTIQRLTMTTATSTAPPGPGAAVTPLPRPAACDGSRATTTSTTSCAPTRRASGRRPVERTPVGCAVTRPSTSKSRSPSPGATCPAQVSKASAAPTPN